MKLILEVQIHKLNNTPIINVGKISVLVDVGINKVLGVGKINHVSNSPPNTDRTTRGIIAVQECRA